MAASEVLESARLTLRPVAEADVPRLVALWNDPTVRRVHGLGTEPLPEEAARRWLAEPARPLAWIARERAGGRAVGVIEMSPLAAGAGADTDAFELGIALDAAARGRGLGREMIARLCLWAFEERHAACVVAEVRQDNRPALRAFAAAGFRPEGGAGEGEVVRMRRPRAGTS